MVSGYANSHQVKVVTIEEIISHFLLHDANNTLEETSHKIAPNYPPLRTNDDTERSDKGGSNTQAENGSGTSNSEIMSSHPTWSTHGDFEVNIHEILSSYSVWSTHDGTELNN